MSAQTYRDRLAALFTARPGEWIDGLELELVGGRYAWRSRVSDCRRELGMVIENRLVRTDHFTKSEYRYVPPVERQGEPTADLNSWSLT